MNRKEKGTLTAAFTGGGGKTSLIFYLVEKFSRQGKRVIVTTTTHMAWEPECPFAEAEDIPEAVQPDAAQYILPAAGEVMEAAEDVFEKLAQFKSSSV